MSKHEKLALETQALIRALAAIANSPSVSECRAVRAHRALKKAHERLARRLALRMAHMDAALTYRKPLPQPDETGEVLWA